MTPLLLTRILREKEVLEIVPLSKSTLRRLESKKQFPQRMKLSDRAVGWSESEIHDWLAAREASNNHHSTTGGNSL